MTYRASNAIARSANYDEIAELWEALAGDLEYLERECEGSVEVENGVWDFWGTDDDGDPWRVYAKAD